MDEGAPSLYDDMSRERNVLAILLLVILRIKRNATLSPEASY
jgi:hypothetical protein